MLQHIIKIYIRGLYQILMLCRCADVCVTAAALVRAKCQPTTQHLQRCHGSVTAVISGTDKASYIIT